MIPVGKQWTVIISLLLSMLCAWSFALAASSQLERTGNISVLHCDTISFSQLAHMREREKRTEVSLDFTAWKQINYENLESLELGKTVFVDAIAFSGQPEMIFPQAGGLSPQDLRGCIIDKQTSYQLFGDDNALGGTIVYDGREYFVRNIISAPKGLFLFVPPEEKEIAFDRISLSTAGLPFSQRGIEEFSYRHGISVNFSISNGVYQGMGKLFAFLPPAAIFATLLFRMFFWIKKKRDYPVLMGIGLLIMTFIIAMLLWITDFHWSLPESFIPTRWSDFEFWGKLWSQWMQHTKQFIFMEKCQTERYLLSFVITSMLYGIVSFLIFLLWIRKLHLLSSKQLFLTMVFSLSATFISVILVGGSHSPNGSTRMLWLLLPFYFLVDYMLKNEREQVRSGSE